MVTPNQHDLREDDFIQIVRARLNRAAQYFERFAADLRELAGTDGVGTRAGYAEAVVDVVDGLGNVIDSAQLSFIVQHAATADTERELARQQREYETPTAD